MYTQARDATAAAYLRSIDPAERLFGGDGLGRVFVARRDQCGNACEPKSFAAVTERLGVPAEFAVIVDDAVHQGVWFTADRPNILPVPPWDGDARDAELDRLLDLLRTIHTQFFMRLVGIQRALSQVTSMRQLAECMQRWEHQVDCRRLILEVLQQERIRSPPPRVLDPAIQALLQQ